MSTDPLKNNRMDSISLTLKFACYHHRLDYSMNDSSTSIIQRLYRDAEKWLRQIAESSRSLNMIGRYTMYLYRVPAMEFNLIPIKQHTDIEQNSLIEIVLVSVEANQSSHKLYRCQLNLPTNCSYCSEFIAGLYKQSFRCRQCRLTFHKNCANYLADDCQGQAASDATIFTIINPIADDLPWESPLVLNSPSSSPAMEKTFDITTSTVIDKGIFPALLFGASVYQRYAFYLTIDTLTITTSLSRVNSASRPKAPPGDGEMSFSLLDITELVLTHFQEDRPDVFQIFTKTNNVISVGKKTDSLALQMDAAQFYSSIRDQWEALSNATPLPSPLLTPGVAFPVPPATPPATGTVVLRETRPPLAKKDSIYALPPPGEDKDMHQLYAFTGEKIGKGRIDHDFSSPPRTQLAGQFGRVVGAYRKSSNQRVAIKVIEKTNFDDEDIRRSNEEINHLYKFNHVNTAIRRPPLDISSLFR